MTSPESPPVLSDPVAPRKPRRFWLYAPFVLILLLAAGYGGFWLFMRQALASQLDARGEALGRAGYVVAMEDRRIDGFPFRMKLSYGQARIVAPSGWAVEAPRLEGEAYLHDIGHWVLVAPQGLTVVRPKGGAIAVKGQVLRASVVRTPAAPWRIVLEGSGLSFTTPPGAQPFSMAAAERLEAYLKPSGGADGEGLFLLRAQGVKATPGTVLGRLAGDKASAATADGRLTKLAAFKGQDWAQAVRAWGQAGGQADQVKLSFSGGPVGADAAAGVLGVGAEGRLVGALPLNLKSAPQALGVLGEAKAVDPDAAGVAAAVAAARAQGQSANLNLVFQAGVVTLGPVKIGPSPKVG